MSAVTAEGPDYLWQQAKAVAEQERISLDELVSLVLASHVSARQVQGCMQERARRGSRMMLKTILQKAPDVNPPEWDRLPEGFARVN